MGLPTRLKRLRLLHKMTQEELGKKINVTKVSISGYENGTRSPDLDTLLKLSEVLNVSTDYLLGISDTPTNHENKTNSILSEDLIEYLEKSENLHVGGFRISEAQKKIFIDFLKSVYRRENGNV